MTTPLPPRTKADRFMPIVAVVLGLAHLGFGATKLVAIPTLVDQFRAWQLPPWMMYFVGVAQVLGGVGLLIRNLRLPSSFAMALVMIGATVTVLATGHEVFNAPLTIVLSLLCFAVAAHRLPQFAREFVAGERRTTT
jgi:putative oxidoreductase